MVGIYPTSTDRWDVVVPADSDVWALGETPTNQIDFRN